MIVTGCGSLLAGITGYFAARAGAVRLLGSLAYQVPAAKHIAFLADLWAHLAAYGVGSVGGIVICGWMLFRRRQMANQRRQSPL